MEGIGILEEVTFHSVIESPKFMESQNHRIIDKLSSKKPTGIVESNFSP